MIKAFINMLFMPIMMVQCQHFNHQMYIDFCADNQADGANQPFTFTVRMTSADMFRLFDGWIDLASMEIDLASMGIDLGLGLGLVKARRAVTVCSRDCRPSSALSPPGRTTGVPQLLTEAIELSSADRSAQEHDEKE